MLDLPFLLDKCEECGTKWRPGDRDASRRCLVCGSSNVTLARPGLLIGAGAAVLGLGAVVFAATRLHEHGQETDAAPPKVASTPSYVAPISTALPGSQPGASAGTPAATPNAAKENGDASTAAADAKGAGDVHVMPAGEAPTAEQFPTMDCSVSKSEAARKVCASPTLKKMDQELSLLYGFAEQNANDKPTMGVEQYQWQHNVLEACGDEACMVNAYKQRAEQLTGEISGQNQ